jgi:hypothetical protein
VTTTTAARNGSHRPEPPPERLPVSSLFEAAEHLRRPYMPNALKWKIQTQFGGEKNDKGRYVKPPSGGIVIAYIDARLVVEHLNKVVPHLWSMRTELLSLGQGGSERGMRVKCWLTIDGIERADVGVGSGPEAFKAAHSDALKRAAKLYGVGVSLHAVPQIKLFAGNGANQLAVRGGESRGFNLALTEATLAKLRDGYERWLDDVGIRQFGQPLDHGDVENAAGDPADPDAQADEDAEPTGALFEDPDPPPPTGRKITAVRAQELAELFARTDASADDLLAFLHRIGAKADDDVATALKGLRVSQAAQVEGWIGTLGATA